MAVTFLLVFQTAVYAFCLILYTAVALALLSRLLTAFVTSARVANSIFDAAGDRLWSLGAPYLGWLVLFVVFALPVSGHGDLLRFPPPGSEAREWGENIATLSIFVWVSEGLAITGGTGVLYKGLMRNDQAFKLARYSQYCLMGILALGPLMYALHRPGPFASIGILIAVFSGIALQYDAFRHLAVIRRNRAPRASEIKEIESTQRPYAAHLSDIHIALPNVKLVQGGDGGNEQLASLVQRWIENPKDAPRVVLITGDVIDRGQSEEWGIAMPLLKKLCERNMRVVLAPGNHDLATAYRHRVAGLFMAHSSKQLRFVDTQRIKEYLLRAAEIEPALVSHDGRPIGELLKTEEQKYPDFLDAWRSAAEAAAEQLKARRIPHLRNVTSRANPRALGVLAVHLPQAAAQLVDPLVDRAAEILSFEDAKLIEVRFRRELLRRPDFTLPELFSSGLRWRRLWYESFPLRLVDNEYFVEYLIVNSNAPEPGLAGSGFGYLGKPQMGRFRELVKASKARTLVVLMHHSVCGWMEQKSDRHGMTASVERWAFLAHETGESHEVLETLGKEAPASCERVLLCCGHRHGSSMVGRVVNPRNGTPLYPRLVVMESAALPDFSFKPPGSRNTNTVLGLCGNSGQVLSPCTVSLN